MLKKCLDNLMLSTLYVRFIYHLRLPANLSNHKFCTIRIRDYDIKAKFTSIDNSCVVISL